MRTSLLEIRNFRRGYPVYGPLSKLFPPKAYIRVMSSMSLNLYKGETCDLVGRSGCGKSTTGCSILGLVRPDRDEILYRGRDLARLGDGKFRPLYRDLQVVFQNILSSLNPRSRIGILLEEPLIVQGMGDTKGRRQKVLETLEGVRLSGDYYFRYPHELSGDQIQRLGTARVLIIEPKLIICDEPVSALDMSIQSQVLNILASLQRRVNLGMLFIFHDIGVVRYISSRIGVIYLDILVEGVGTNQLFAHTPHPYTQTLFASIPDFSKRGGSVSLQGELPMHANKFKGCVFHTCCPYVSGKCRKSAPKLTEIRPGHRVACHRAG